ncbi:MAG: retropepsin-like aspartic protease [Cyanobacteria bacterium P01_H01_bin.35]
MMENSSLYNSSDRNLVKHKQQRKTRFWQIPSILLTTLICTAAIAQEYPGCFMLDEAGNRKDLTISVCRLFPEDLPEEVSTSTAAAGLYEIPIVKRTNGEEGSPIVNVTFNDGQSYEMVLDTGATSTLITQKMADSLKVIPSGQGTAKVADGRVVDIGIGLVSSISAGGLEYKQFTVAIAPPGQQIGLLGQDFFGRYDMSIKEKVVELKVRSSS